MGIFGIRKTEQWQTCVWDSYGIYCKDFTDSLSMDYTAMLHHVHACISGSEKKTEIYYYCVDLE